MSTNLQSLWDTIERRLGRCPNFFRASHKDPRTSIGIFDIAEFAYLDCPLPSLFKEQLFAYLSRICQSKYCLATHVAILAGYGPTDDNDPLPALAIDQIIDLLEEPLPSMGELQCLLGELQRQAAKTQHWPSYDSRQGYLLRIACWQMLTKGAAAEQWNRACQSYLGEVRHEQLLLFLSFIRLSHFWSDLHPELSLDAEIIEFFLEYPRLFRTIEEIQSCDASPLADPPQPSWLEQLDQARASEARLQQVVESIPQLVWTCTPTGECDFLSRQWIEYTWIAEELQTGFGWLEQVHPDDRAATILAWQEATSQEIDFRTEFRIRRRDGQYRWFHTLAVPHRDRQNRIVQWVGTNTDITDKLEAEAELRFQKFALDQSSMVAITDAEGMITYANDKFCETSGYSNEELVGSNHRILKSGLHPDAFFKQMYETISSGKVWRGEIQNRRKDGTLYWVDTTIVPSLDHEGKPLRYVAIRRDISKRKAFEESLKAAKETAESANRSRGEFLANMSHEIRTPMTSILGYADILREKLTDPQDRQSIDTIRHNGHFLLQIINDILDLSKIDSGKLQIEPQAVELRNLFADVESLMAMRAVEKKIEFHVCIDTSVPGFIQVDPVRLRQVLVNLVGNAIKFTHEGKVIVMAKYQPSTEHLSIEIKDSGIGIPAGLLDSLFDPFVQADTSSTRVFEGTGLGLTISQRLARAMGGEITVDSTEGVGSQFTVTLYAPTLPSAKTLCAVSNAVMGEPNTDTAIRTTMPVIRGCVLVVDDRRDVRYLAKYMLERAGASVRTATNGCEAIEALANPSADVPTIDLVLMDMQMPVMDGYSAARKIRQLGFDLPIIALTANAMKEDRQACLDAGCTDYATKPLDGPALLQQIASYLKPLQTET